MAGDHLIPGDPWPLESWPPGWSVDHVAETGSTNDDLLAALEQGDSGDRSVLATDHQTAGRGRQGRTWEAPSGANLLVSLGFTVVPEPAVRLTQRAGLAIVAAVRALTGDRVDATLKWPNDVLVGDRKLAGILAARSPHGPVVVGMGVNVGWSPADATDLAALAASPLHPVTVLAAILNAWDALPPDVAAEYRDRLGTLGRRVRADLPGGSALEGRAVDVADDGRLILLDECAVTHRLDAADVVHLRATDADG